jgi:hypothetical protein
VHISIRKPEGKRLLRRPRVDGRILLKWILKRPLGTSSGRCDDNIKMNLKEIGRKGVDWIHLVQDRGHSRDLVNTVMNLSIP